MPDKAQPPSSSFSIRWQKAKSQLTAVMFLILFKSFCLSFQDFVPLTFQLLLLVILITFLAFSKFRFSVFMTKNIVSQICFCSLLRVGFCESPGRWSWPVFGRLPLRWVPALANTSGVRFISTLSESAGFWSLAAPLSLRSNEHERSLCFTCFQQVVILCNIRGFIRIFYIYVHGVFLRFLLMQSCLKHPDLCLPPLQLFLDFHRVVYSGLCVGFRAGYRVRFRANLLLGFRFI